MATADQHDTLVLTHDTLALPRQPALPRPPAPHGLPGAPAEPVAWDPAGWSRSVMPGASGWSQVPPFLPATPPPVLVMRNNAAVIGATLGSVSLFVSLIPLIGIIAWVLAPLGVVASTLGLLVGVSRKVGRVGAVWGLLTSGGALVVCMAWAALLLAL
jgi:hypothetical protein